MRNRRTFWIALAALVTGAALAQTPPSQQVTVNGTVKRAKGGSAAGLRVALTSSGSSVYSATTATSSTGTCTVAGVPAGQIQANVYDGAGKVLAIGKATSSRISTSVVMTVVIPD